MGWGWGCWSRYSKGQVQGLLSSISPASCRETQRRGGARLPPRTKAELSLFVPSDSQLHAPIIVPSRCSAWGGSRTVGSGSHPCFCDDLGAAGS